jgi:hypothetical protein
MIVTRRRVEAEYDLTARARRSARIHAEAPA